MKTEEKGVLFDIQRFAVNDGPGIRTIVFFKGCPLQCLWCHNPESLSSKQELMYFASKCSGCRMCEQVCPNKVHSFSEEIHSVDFEKCNQCGACLQVCCYDALEIIGKEFTVSDVLTKIEIDKDYFGENGGVTLSGGEPMYQPEFAIALARALWKKNISVCIETSGCAKSEYYEKIAPYIDIVLFDYKATPKEAYKRLVRGNSERILRNLHNLNYLGKKIILRCPMIPGVNDTDQHLQAIANLAAGYTMIDHIELLPYHTMGEMKRVQLGKDRILKDILPPSEKQKERWIETLKAAGCKVKFA